MTKNHKLDAITAIRIKQAETALIDALTDIANDRLRAFGKEWIRRSGKHIVITFGMGGWDAVIEGKRVRFGGEREFKTFHILIEDLCQITQDFHAQPLNLEVAGKRIRLFRNDS